MDRSGRKLAPCASCANRARRKQDTPCRYRTPTSSYAYRASRSRRRSNESASRDRTRPRLHGMKCHARAANTLYSCWREAVRCRHTRASFARRRIRPDRQCADRRECARDILAAWDRSRPLWTYHCLPFVPLLSSSPCRRDGRYKQSSDCLACGSSAGRRCAPANRCTQRAPCSCFQAYSERPRSWPRIRPEIDPRQKRQPYRSAREICPTWFLPFRVRSLPRMREELRRLNSNFAESWFPPGIPGLRVYT
jgi:hypothetical protein